MFPSFYEDGINFLIQVLVILLCSTSSLAYGVHFSQWDCQWFKLQQGYPIIQVVWYDISFNEIKLISVPFLGELQPTSSIFTHSNAHRLFQSLQKALTYMVWWPHIRLRTQDLPLQRNIISSPSKSHKPTKQMPQSARECFHHKKWQKSLFTVAFVHQRVQSAHIPEDWTKVWGILQ